MAEPNEADGIAAVFFDLGNTLGTAVGGGTPPRLTGFDVFPFVDALLADLRGRGLRLGVISNTGTDTAAEMDPILRTAGLLDRLDADLLVYSGDEGVTKASREIFDRASARASEPARRCLFVGENAGEREVAGSAGWAVCADPQAVAELLATPAS